VSLSAQERAPSARLVAPCLVVVLTACLPYLSTLHDYFVQDDFGVVQLMARRPWTMFFQWFTTPWTENIWMYTPDEIRPFVALSYVMTASWGAAEPSAHHALNIAIHALNGLLVMAIARRVAGLSVTSATFAAVIFVLLPVQAESVAWITGRVDSLPTLAYLAAFLAYVRWRSGRTAAYAWSLLWFFVALFSKQNTITMPALLIAYDAVVLRRPVRISWGTIRPYVPFVLMTIGFLALRYAIAGTVVRESELTADHLRLFGGVVMRHSERIVAGHAGARGVEWIPLLLVVAAGAVLFIRAESRGPQWAVLMFFGLVWWALGIAPTLVAGYESPRHVYLASVGWAVTLAVVLDALRTSFRNTWLRAIVHVAGAALVVLYGWQLRTVVAQWNRAADISRLAVARLQREAMAVPPGTLVIVGVPTSSWEWAVPFMAQPPYTRTDLTTRVSIVTPWRLHCCRSQWLDYTRSTLEQWAGRTPPTPVVALYFNPKTGAMSRLTQDEYPGLRSIVQTFVRVDTLDSLDLAILRMLDELVARRPPVSAALESTR
jgi:hypothetical protein